MTKIDPLPGMASVAQIEQTMAELAEEFDKAFKEAEQDLQAAYSKAPELAGRLDGMARAFNWRSMDVGRISEVCLAKGFPIHFGRYFSAGLPNNLKLRINLNYSDGTTSARNANKLFEDPQEIIEGMEPPTEIVIGRQMASGGIVEATVVTCPTPGGFTIRRRLSEFYDEPREGGSTGEVPPPPAQPVTKTKLKAKRMDRDEDVSAFKEPAVFPDPADVKEDELHG